MLIISDKLLNETRDSKYKVYSKAPLDNNVECFSSSNSFKNSDKFYITATPISHIRYTDGKFYYTSEDLSSTADWFPAHVIPIGNTFVKCKGKKHKIGTVIGSNKCVVDVSGLPAFNGVNEDISIYEYRFYITLFNNYTIKQIIYDRYNLFDLKLKSSKYDLVSKLQNANLIKPNEFVMINNKRKDEESVRIGVVIKESGDKSRSIEYGDVYINMNNIISIKWN